MSNKIYHIISDCANFDIPDDNDETLVEPMIHCSIENINELQEFLLGCSFMVPPEDPEKQKFWVDSDQHNKKILVDNIIDKVNGSFREVIRTTATLNLDCCTISVYVSTKGDPVQLSPSDITKIFISSN